MRYQFVRSRRRSSRKLVRRLMGAATLAALLILLPWNRLPDLGQQIAGWYGSTPQQAAEETVQVADTPALPVSDVVVAAVEDVDGGFGTARTAPPAPGYVTTQPLELEFASPASPEFMPPASLVPGDESPLGPTPAPTPWIALPGGPATGPGQGAQPPVIAAVPGGGFGSPPAFSPPSGSAPPVSRAPGGNGPAPLAPNTPAAPSASDLPIASVPNTPVAPSVPDLPIASVPNTPAAPSVPDLPIASVPNTPAAPSAPESPIASLPNTPANAPALVELPAQLDDPVIVSNTAPEDSWYSPGHSPGVLDVDSPFELNGRTLLFEILGDEAGLEYDQLVVGDQGTGTAKLDDGVVVFAFIDGFTPDSTDLFKLIVASSIEVDFSQVDFYYGFFDTPYNLHAPYDLSQYFKLEDVSDILMLDSDPENSDDLFGTTDAFEDWFAIKYAVAAEEVEESITALGEDGTPRGEGEIAREDLIAIGTPVPAPAPLLLLATGLLAAGSFRRLRRG